MVGEKADGQSLFGARSEKQKILFDVRGEKRTNLFGAKRVKKNFIWQSKG